MNFITAANTDVGIKKKTNQDSLLIQQASTEYGTVLLAVMCDGMGGLAKGETASACAINAFSNWFSNEFPQILYSGMNSDELCESWRRLSQETNIHIMEYGSRHHIDLGTTAAVLLIVENTYYIMNVGDSRVYLISDDVYQLTKDQTFVQQEIDRGRMTEEEAFYSPQRSILLQCIGASGTVEPDFFTGTVEPGQSYLICCDGFRHVITANEFHQYLGPQNPADKESIRQNLVYLTELNKQRNETDNITAAVIRTI